MLFISFIQVIFLNNYYLSKLPKIDLNVAVKISQETAGFIENKYTHFYGFTYIHVHSYFFIMTLIKLDAVKNKK